MRGSVHCFNLRTLSALENPYICFQYASHYLEKSMLQSDCKLIFIGYMPVCLDICSMGPFHVIIVKVILKFTKAIHNRVSLLSIMEGSLVEIKFLSRSSYHTTCKHKTNHDNMYLEIPLLLRHVYCFHPIYLPFIG